MASAGMFGGALPWLLGPVAGAAIGGGFNGSSDASAHPSFSGQPGDGNGPTGIGGGSISIPAVPEPGTWMLMAFGLIGLIIRARSNAVGKRR
jgi:hypothetical protein